MFLHSVLLWALLLGSFVASASAKESTCSSADPTCSDQTALLQGRVKLASMETDASDDLLMLGSDDDEDSPSDSKPTTIPMSGNGSLTSANFGSLNKGSSTVNMTTTGAAQLNFTNVKGYGQAHNNKVFVGTTADGNATLDMIKKSQGIYGSIVNIGTNTVTQIGHDANGNTVATTHNSSDYPDDAPPVNSGQDDFLLFEQGLLQVDESGLADDGSIIDVMVVWTHHAECANSQLSKGCTLTPQTETNMKGLIQLAVLESNTAFDLSTVNTNLRLVHMYRDPTGYDESAGFSDALNKITDTSDGVMDGVHAERAKYRADVVALVISNPQYCGLAWMGPSKSRMFSVAAWNCATGYYSFVHEIMHNFGCHHDRGTKGSCSSSASNYGYRDPDGQFRSIMAYNCRTGQCDNIKKSGCTRVQRVSNPTTKYQGKPIGSAVADNAKQVNKVRKIVAQYYNSNSAPPATTVPPATPQPTQPPPTTVPPATGAPTTMPPFTGGSKCSFEMATTKYCGMWENVGGDEFDWSRRSGQTPSWGTGPAGASDGSSYMYIETSSPRRQGDKAILRTTSAVQLGSTAALSFDYHMKGNDIDTLKVLVDADVVFQLQGAQGGAWKSAQVSLANYAGKAAVVMFVGYRGSSWGGDIAIDNVVLKTGGGSGPTTVMTTTTPPTMPPTTMPPTTMAPPATTMAPTMPPTTMAPPATTMAPPVTTMAPSTTMAPTMPPTTMAPPSTTMAPPVTTMPPSPSTVPPSTTGAPPSLEKKIDDLVIKVDAMLKLVKSLVNQSSLN